MYLGVKRERLTYATTISWKFWYSIRQFPYWGIENAIWYKRKNDSKGNCIILFITPGDMMTNNKNYPGDVVLKAIVFKSILLRVCFW